MNSVSDYFVPRNYLENNFLRPQTLLNTNFNVWQRNLSLTSADIVSYSGYTADRWLLSFPADQLLTVFRDTSFVTSNKLSEYSYGINLTSTTAVLPASSQYLLRQKLEGNIARQLLYKPVVFSGKVQTNKAGIYSAVCAWNDATTGRTIYSVYPVTLLGNGTEETFKAVFQPCPNTFTPVTGSGLSLTIGLVLAGNLTSVVNVYLSVANGSESYCASGQVNFFDTQSNYIKFSQFTLNAGVEPQVFVGNPDIIDRVLCQRYFERKPLAVKAVNLTANTTTHYGSVEYLYKRSSSPVITFSNLDETKTTISNSSSVFYSGGSVALTQSSFAAFGRTTNATSGFTFNTASNVPATATNGYINQDVLINSEL